MGRDRQKREREEDSEGRDLSRENRGFVQVYPMAWQRMRALMATKKTAGAARLYSVLAEHIDTAGAVVATQDVLAEMLGVSVKTVQRHSTILEDVSALVRIPLAGGVYAYCLNPHEVWKAYDSEKEHSAFTTRTLVNVRGKQGAWIKRRLNVLMQAAKGLPVSPGAEGIDEDGKEIIDPETGEVMTDVA